MAAPNTSWMNAGSSPSYSLLKQGEKGTVWRENVRTRRSMPRGRRVAPGGLVYHVWNRGVARLALFEQDADYEAFERVLAEAMQEFPTRRLSYCLMPNHWHMVIWPRKAGELYLARP
jgi:hypothetical protein